MSIIITKTPQEILPDGHTLRIAAGYNPITLELGRKDMVITSVEAGDPVSTSDGIITPTKINIVAFDTPDGAAFTEVYIDATFAGVSLIKGIYDRIGTLTRPTFSSFTILLPWSAAFSDVDGGFASLILGQKIEAIIFPKVKDTQIYTVAPASFSFNREGTCTIYLNSIYEDYFSERINAVDRYLVGQTLGIELEIYASIPGVEQSETPDLTISFADGFYASKSVVQIGDNPFLSDYAIYKAGGRVSTERKFLTDMAKPVRFGSLPFALYALIDDVSEATQINRIVGGVTTNIDATEFDDTGIYQFIVDGSTQLKADGTDNLTELKEVIATEYCELTDNIYLSWENNSGGFDHYLFRGNVSENFRSGTTEMFEPFIENVKNATSNFKILEKRFEETMRGFATFDKANKEAFKQLAYSKQVKMYDGTTWYQVDVEVNSYRLAKDNSYGKIAITVMPPKTYLK